MRLNEAIVFQKETENPIAGLLITDTPSPETVHAFLDILNKNTSLDLYLHEKSSKKHIIRVLSNKQAQE